MALTTHPGSQELEVVLRDGSTVHVRPAKPSDAPAVTLLLRGLSDRSRRLRFFSAFPNLATAARWATEVEDDRRYGLVATVDGHGQIVGHAGFERESDRPDRAEVALEIADAMQGKGLGTALLRQLAEAANELGIRLLDAEVLPENRQMIRVFRDCGYPAKVHTLRGVELVELRTSDRQPGEPAANGLGPAPRSHWPSPVRPPGGERRGRSRQPVRHRRSC
jgi:RimJ/RimL family protein N-acetyltransferase